MSNAEMNRLALETMQVYTNDALSGLNSIELDDIKPGQTTAHIMHAYRL